MAKRKPNKNPTLEDVFDQSERTTTALNKKIKGNQRALLKSIKNIEKRVVSEFATLKVNGKGNLVGPRVNLKQAQHLHSRLVAIFEEDYGKTVKEQIGGYNEVAGWIKDNFKEFDVATSFTDVDRTMMTQLRKQNLLEFTTVSQQAQGKISQAMYNSIAAGAPMDELVKQITGALIGHKDARGNPLSQYADLYASDGVMNFYNSVHLEKGKQAGLESMLYVGDIINTTRDFCAKRVMKVYTIDEINSWTHNWAGKRGPALNYRGGWNCRHHWRPVKKAWVKELSEKYGPPVGAEGPAVYKKSTPAQIKNQLSGIKIRASKGKLLVPGSAREAVWFGMPLDERKKIVAGWKAKGIDAPADYLKKTKIAGAPKPKVKPKTKPKVPVSKAPAKEVKPPHKIKPTQSSELNMDSDTRKYYNHGIKNIENQKRSIERDFPEFIKEKGVRGRAHLTYTPSQVAKRTGKAISPERLRDYKWRKEDLTFWDRRVKQLENEWKNLRKRTWVPVEVKKGDTWFWKKTKNLDEAASQLRELGMGNVQISVFRNEAKLLEMYNSIGEELADMRNRFPGLSFTEKGKNPFEWFKVAAGRGEDGITASYYHKVKGLEIFGQSASLTRKRFFLGKRRGYFAESGIFGDFRHEFGHHVQIQMGKVGKAMKKLDRKWDKLWKKLGEEDFFEKISEYAGDSPLEAFAECFSIFTDPIYGKVKKRLPKVIEEYFEELLQGLFR
jgi:hypothetical protein